MKEKQKDKKLNYRIVPSPKLRGRGMINLRRYPFLCEEMKFPGEGMIRKLTTEEYVELRGDKAVKVIQIKPPTK